MNTNSTDYYNHLQEVAKRHQGQKPKPVNQLIIGVPQNLKGKKFETVDYVYGRSTPKCPYKFEELPNLQYFNRSGDYHLFLSCGEFNHIVICKVVEGEG